MLVCGSICVRGLDYCLPLLVVLVRLLFYAP